MLNKDAHPLDQPNGTFRYILNGAIETNEGDLGRISTELGHLDCAAIPGTILNYEALPDNKYVVFVRSDIDEIGLLDRCEYTTLFKDVCLSFGDNLFSTYRVRGGCETVIYFTDYKNPVRAFSLETPPTSCDELDLFLGAIAPNIDVTVNAQGGQVPAGSYIFGIRYLDDNETPTEWLNFSQPVNTLVTASTYGTLVGLTDISPVSFELTMDRLDLRYPYYQIGILPYKSGIGTPSIALVSPKTRSSNQTFRWNGTEVGYTTTTVDDFIVQGLQFRRAKYITQLENRLILAGVAERSEDWCLYQEYVNKITTNYTVVERDMLDIEPEYGKTLSYMGDEVYAYSVVFAFDDGTYSPAFHIPGRAAVPYDLDSLAITTAFPSTNEIKATEVEHLGLEIGQNVIRWKAQNTSQGNGQMAYHQSESTYPVTERCDGQLVWGELAGQPVRHHRFPSRKVEPHIAGGKIRHLGITFSGVQYPSDNIVGHFFLRGVRSDVDRTILDKGVFLETWEVEGGTAFGEMKQDPKKLNDGNTTSQIATSTAFISPKILSGRSLFTNYIAADYTLKYFGNPESYQYAVTGAINDVVAMQAEIRQYDQGTTPITYTNKLVQDQVLLEPRELQAVAGTSYRNASFTNRMQVMKSTHDFMTQELVYGAVKQQVNPFDVLEAIEYTPISEITIDTTITALSGDTFISEMAVGNIIGGAGEVSLRGGFFGQQQAQLGVFASYLFGVYVESTIPYYPLEGENNCEKYYISPQRTTLNDFEEEFALDILEYLVSLISTTDDELAKTYVDPCPLVYDYSEDFSIPDRFAVYFPLSNYDCCQSCQAEFTNRIAYSEQSFQEETIDTYRSFLGNNYRDLEGNTGEITQIKRWEDRLIIFTQENVWWLPPQNQERVNSEGIVSYVGTGSLFAISPKRFNTSKSAGCKDPYSVIETPEGLFFYDSRSGIPYIVNRGLQPINQGMSRWFSEAAKRGGVVHAGYDEDLNRVLVTSLGEGCGQTWTLSYSFQAKSWISFHSYTPLRYMSGKNELIVVDDKFYTAHEGVYTTYKGVKQPFIIEDVQRAQETRTWDYVEFYTEAYEDGAEETWSTFNKIWAYNNYQSTGIIPLTTRNEQQDVNFMRTRVTSPSDLDRDERNWRVNNLKSVVSKEGKVFVNSCELEQTDIYPATFGPIDWYNQEPLRSKYLLIRYIFSILGNKKLVFFYGKV